MYNHWSTHGVSNALLELNGLHWLFSHRSSFIKVAGIGQIGIFSTPVPYCSGEF